MSHWLTVIPPVLPLAHTVQAAAVEVPDERIQQCTDIYELKKITRASLNLVDTPGLCRDQEGSEGNLPLMREAGCLGIVVGRILVQRSKRIFAILKRINGSSILI